MAPHGFHVLLVEDSATYATYVRDALAVGDAPFAVSHADCLADAIKCLGKGGIDVVLLDLCLPDSEGLATLHRMQAAAPDVPMVVLTGVLDQSLAMAAVQSGAQDYLVKSEIQSGVVTRVVRYAIERRAADARLRERDAHYRSIVESSLDAIVSMDRDGCIIEFNPAAEVMFGWSRADAVGKELAALLMPERTQPAHRDALARHLAERHAPIAGRRLELTGLRADGSEFPLELTLSKVSTASGPVFTGFIRDLSERRRAEDAQRISDERFRLLSGATNDVIWDWNIETNALWWNENFEAVFGYRRDEIEPTLDGWTTRIHPEDAARVTKTLDDLFEHGGTRFWAEYRFRRKSGDYAFVLDRGQVIRNEAGKPVRMVGGMADITERKELERRFLRAQRMESIGTLAGGIAHDLNNVLTPVLMSIELLKDNPTEREQHEILATIEASTRRGAEMVRQVLTFARGVEGDRTAVDVAGLLKEVEKFANDTFKKNITVRTAVDGDVAVLGDATQLHQVLINLCVNARDAMPQGGTLDLSAGIQTLLPGDADLDAVVRPGQYVVICVKDTGTGIPPRLLDRVFEPFFTGKATGKGTGLGLSTSLAIVRSHGGLMRVDSEVGRGSTFAVYLPALAGRAEPARKAPARDLARGDGELILVVDDEEPVLRMTTLVLESFGYRVLSAGGGAEAVALFATHRDDIRVVLTDMTMPGMDGAAVIEKVRELDASARVIAASGLGAHEAAHVAGVMRFLPKPYTADTLLKAVTDAVRA